MAQFAMAALSSRERGQTQGERQCQQERDASGTVGLWERRLDAAFTPVSDDLSASSEIPCHPLREIVSSCSLTCFMKIGNTLLNNLNFLETRIPPTFLRITASV